jgi:hypothetical protein
MKEYDFNSIRLSDLDMPIYLCKWNDGEIIEIHSLETLIKEYQGTNLFDPEYWHCIGKDAEEDYFYEDKQGLRLLLGDMYMNDDFREAICDNCSIQRIR